VVALDAQTGRLAWEYDYGTNMWVESSPTLVNGILYIGSSGNQYVVGLDGQAGSEFTKLNTATFNWSTPLVVSDTLLIGAATYQKPYIGGLLAIKLAGGKLPAANNLDRFRWYLTLDAAPDMSEVWSGVASSPVMADGVIYFGGLDGRLYAVRGEVK
jgi:outer membrane protein assembly factor BamB